MDKKRSVTRTCILTGLLVLAVIAVIAAIPVAKGALKAFAEWRYRCEHCKVCGKTATHNIVEYHADVWKSEQYGLCDGHAKAYSATTPATARPATQSPTNP